MKTKLTKEQAYLQKLQIAQEILSKRYDLDIKLKITNDHQIMIVKVGNKGRPASDSDLEFVHEQILAAENQLANMKTRRR